MQQLDTLCLAPAERHVADALRDVVRGPAQWRHHRRLCGAGHAGARGSRVAGGGHDPRRRQGGLAHTLRLHDSSVSRNSSCMPSQAIAVVAGDSATSATSPLRHSTYPTRRTNRENNGGWMNPRVVLCRCRCACRWTRSPSARTPTTRRRRASSRPCSPPTWCVCAHHSSASHAHYYRWHIA